MGQELITAEMLAVASAPLMSRRSALRTAGWYTRRRQASGASIGQCALKSARADQRKAALTDHQR